MEEAVPGQEYGVDGAVINGETIITLIRKKMVTPLPNRQAVGNIAVCEGENSGLYQKVLSFLSDVADVLKYEDCIINADIIVNGDDIFLVEIAPRPSGHYLHDVFIPCATQVDLCQEYLKLLLGQECCFSPDEVRCMMIHYLDFEECRIVSVPEEELLRTSGQCRLLRWECGIHAGDHMGRVTDGHSVMDRGYFIVEGTDEADLIRQSKWILSQFDRRLDMDYVEENKKIWEEHFKSASLDFPNEEVVRFLAKCRWEYQGGTMLDWGCATGRHTVLGHRFGFRMIAVDYVEHCVNCTREKMEKEYGEEASDTQYYVNQDIDVKQIPGESLDVVLAFGVVFLNSKEKQQEMLNNIYRMLKKGGRAFCDFRTENDSIYQNQYQDSGEGDMLLLPNGVKLCILPLDELKEMFAESGFTVESLELNEFTQDNQKVHNSWWHVTLLK